MWCAHKKYRVKLQGRAGLIYQEDNKVMVIDSELLVGSTYDIVVYFDSIKTWQPPYENETLSDSDRARIKTNISTELDKLRIDWR